MLALFGVILGFVLGYTAGRTAGVLECRKKLIRRKL